VRHFHRIVTAVAGVGLALFTAFVWPTKFRYSEMRAGTNVIPIRINRFTGGTDFFVGQWVLEQPQHVIPAAHRPHGPESLPQEALQKLEVLQQSHEGSEMTVTIYNGSAYTLEDVTAEIAVARLRSQPIAKGSAYEGLSAGAVADLRKMRNEPEPPKLRDSLPTRRFRLIKASIDEAGSLQTSRWKTDVGVRLSDAEVAVSLVVATGREIESPSTGLRTP